MSAKFAILSSNSLNGSLESKTKSAISAFSNIAFVRIRAYFSIPSILLLLLTPAVSTKLITLSLYVVLSSTGSIVVPATELTTALSSPTREFKRELLPTLTLPIIATFISFVSSCVSGSIFISSKSSKSKLSSSISKSFIDNSGSFSGRYSDIQFKSFVTPRLCETDIGKTFSAPNSSNSQALSISLSLSILLITKAIGLF